MKKEELCEKIEEIVKYLIQFLEDNEISYFQGKPTAEVSCKGSNIMVSLIDDNNSDIICKLEQDPQYGKTHFFIEYNLLENNMINSSNFAFSQAMKIKEELNENSAFTTNIERVSNLVIDNHYSVALVFIVSALESITSDLFFRYNYLWFHNKTSKLYEVDNDLFFKYGIKTTARKENESFSYLKEINGEMWGITQTAYHPVQNWNILKVWKYIYKTSKKLNVFEEYSLSLFGNKLSEIGTFDILKDVLLTKKRINFQSLEKIPGVTWAYNRFFGINIEEMNDELKVLKDVINKRHRIIHGNLKDDEIEEKEVKEAIDSLKRIVNFLKDKITRLDRQYYRDSFFFQ